jgi:hypothetical protein
MEKNNVGNLTRLLFKNRTETDLRELLISRIDIHLPSGLKVTDKILQSQCLLMIPKEMAGITDAQLWNIGYRIDSPVHKISKSLLNKGLLQARNSAYKPAYKQNRKNAPNEAQKQLDHASPATTANMYADISFEDMQNGVNGLYQ